MAAEAIVPGLDPALPPDEGWCRVLESYGLDPEQAQALTRIVVLRSRSWQARCRSLIADARLRDALLPPPADPALLQRGLGMFLERQENGYPLEIAGD